MSSRAARIENDLLETAASAGRINGRSAAQQLNHWARVGRELEASPSVTLDAVERVLTGQDPYDAADDGMQAAVRAAWEANITARIASLDLTDFAPGMHDDDSPG